jgi:hypothetical protein
VQRDRVLGVDQPNFRVQKADLAPLAFDRGLDGLAAQQGVDDADVLLHFGELDGAEPHRPARGKAGADAEINASRRYAVQCRKRVRGDRCYAVRGDQDASAKADP